MEDWRSFYSFPLIHFLCAGNAALKWTISVPATAALLCINGTNRLAQSFATDQDNRGPSCDLLLGTGNEDVAGRTLPRRCNNCRGCRGCCGCCGHCGRSVLLIGCCWHWMATENCPIRSFRLRRRRAGGVLRLQRLPFSFPHTFHPACTCAFAD